MTTARLPSMITQLLTFRLLLQWFKWWEWITDLMSDQVLPKVFSSSSLLIFVLSQRFHQRYLTRIDTTTYITLNSVTNITIMYQRCSVDYTCFKNIRFHKVRLLVNKVQFSDTGTSIISARSSQMQHLWIGVVQNIGICTVKTSALDFRAGSESYLSYITLFMRCSASGKCAEHSS